MLLLIQSPSKYCLCRVKPTMASAVVATLQKAVLEGACS